MLLVVWLFSGNLLSGVVTAGLGVGALYSANYLNDNFVNAGPKRWRK